MRPAVALPGLSVSGINIVANGQPVRLRGILSFNTGAILPDNAVITSVTLKIKKSGITGGGNPVTAFQGFMKVHPLTAAGALLSGSPLSGSLIRQAHRLEKRMGTQVVQVNLGAFLQRVSLP